MGDIIPRFSDPEERHHKLLLTVLTKLKELRFKENMHTIHKGTILKSTAVHFVAPGFGTFMFNSHTDEFISLIAEDDTQNLNRVELCFELQTAKLITIRVWYSDTKKIDTSWDYLVSDTHLIGNNLDIIPISHFTDNVFQYCTVTPLVDLLLEYM